MILISIIQTSPMTKTLTLLSALPELTVTTKLSLLPSKLARMFTLNGRWERAYRKHRTFSTSPDRTMLSSLQLASKADLILPLRL